MTQTPSLAMRYSVYLHLMRPRQPPQTIPQKQETYEEWLAKQGTPYAGRPTENGAPVSPPIVSGAPYPGGGRVIVPEQVHKPYRPAIERLETPWARFLRAESPAERYGRGLQQAERLQVAPVRPFGVPVEQRYGIVGFIGEAERQVRQTFAPGKGELKGAHPSHLRTVREWERRYPGYMAGVAAFRFAEIAVVSKGIEKGLGVMKKAVGGREWLLGPERYAEAQWQLIGYKPAPEYKSPFKKPSRIERVTTPLKRVVLGEKRYAESLWREMGVLKAEKMARLTSPLPQIGRGLPLEFYYHAPVRYDVTYALGRVVPKGAKIFYSPLTAQFLWKAPTYIPKKAPSLVPVTKEYEVFLQRGVMELKPHKVLVHTPKKGWHYQEFMFEEKFAKETYPWVKPIWKTGKKGFAQVSLLIQKQRVAQITRTPFQVTLQKTLTPKLPTKIGEATKMFVGVTQITKVTPTRKRPVEKITPQLITKPFPSIVEAWKLREYHAVTPKRIQRQRQKQIEKLRQIKITEPRLKQRERLTQKGRQRIDLVTEQVSIQRVYVPLRLSAMSARKIPPIPPLKLPRAGGFDERRFGIGFGEWFKRKHPILTPEQMVKKIGLGLPKRRKIKRRPIRFAL